MKKPDAGELDGMWARHSAEWRDAAQITSCWREAAAIDPSLLESRVRGSWWDTLEELGVTLLVTREYEHLVIGMSARRGSPHISYFPVPHPSGLAVQNERVHLASTRNPNQVFQFQPVNATLQRSDIKTKIPRGNPLLPVSSVLYPVCLYLHDLALFGSTLHGNAVGHNAVARLHANGRFERVWWPKCIESGGAPAFTRNHIQLNSIAAGRTLRESFFSASSCSVGRLRPGHLNYPVDGRGVIFSGRTREPICTGLTRPHSALLHDGKVWVDNSGYGEFGFVRDGKLEVVSRLPGWTRGLCLVADTAFVATSRVIPKFSRYAPGLEFSKTLCGIHAVSSTSGRTLGSIEWPSGKQVFAVASISDELTTGFLFDARSRRRNEETAFCYAYAI